MKKNDRYNYNYKEDNEKKNIWDGGNFYEGEVLEKIPKTREQTKNNLWEVSFERKKIFVLKKDNFLDDITLNNNIYEVSSFIVNHGHSRNKCHNHCIIKKKNNWYFCSDTYIEQVPDNKLNEFIHMMCFSNDFVTPLIFYKRKNDDNLEDVNDNIKGLRNFGNTCFFNCILQCLFHNKYFNNYVKEIKINQPTEILRNHFLENINVNTDNNNKYNQKYFQNINKYEKESSSKKIDSKSKSENYKYSPKEYKNLLNNRFNELKEQKIEIEKLRNLKENIKQEEYERNRGEMEILFKNPVFIYYQIINNIDERNTTRGEYYRGLEQQLINIIKESIKNSDNINGDEIDQNEINEVNNLESLKEFIQRNEDTLNEDIDIAGFIYYSNILDYEDEDEDDEDDD